MLELNVEYKIYSYKDLFDLTLDEALDLRENEKTSSCSMCGTFEDVQWIMLQKILEQM